MTVQEQYTLWRARAIDDPDLTAELTAIAMQSAPATPLRSLDHMCFFMLLLSFSWF